MKSALSIAMLVVGSTGIVACGSQPQNKSFTKAVKIEAIDLNSGAELIKANRKGDIQILDPLARSLQVDLSGYEVQMGLPLSGQVIFAEISLREKSRFAEFFSGSESEVFFYPSTARAMNVMRMIENSDDIELTSILTSANRVEKVMDMKNENGVIMDTKKLLIRGIEKITYKVDGEEKSEDFKTADTLGDFDLKMN